MAKLPTPLIVEKIDKYHEDKNNGRRKSSRIGGSILGEKCARRIWYSFRWAMDKKFSGRMLRLFRRGHLEEEQIISDLKAIGIKISGEQLRLNFGGHITGIIDAIAECGVPEAPEKRHLLEFKTHSLKSFQELNKSGLEKAKYQHYIQMQVYMHGTGIDRGLYIAVCKNDDHIYYERIRYDKNIAETYIARGQTIALEDRPPAKISESPSWYECKFCPAYDLCHGDKLTTEVNCRTCAHSTATHGGEWTCARWGAAVIPLEHQSGCHAHVIHPDLVPWESKSNGNPHEIIYIIDGVEVTNGEADANVFSSQEILNDTKSVVARASGVVS